MVLEKALKGMQFLWDTLDIVKTVNPHEYLSATELLSQMVDPIPYFFRSQTG